MAVRRRKPKNDYEPIAGVYASRRSGFSSFQTSIFSPLAIFSILSIETFRSHRSTELTYVLLIPDSCESASWLIPWDARNIRMLRARISLARRLWVRFSTTHIQLIDAFEATVYEILNGAYKIHLSGRTCSSGPLSAILQSKT